MPESHVQKKERLIEASKLKKEGEYLIHYLSSKNINKKINIKNNTSQMFIYSYSFRFFVIIIMLMLIKLYAYFYR